jgi:coiled-coil-helix-coiled-coil-helix domain-containing protein 2
MPAARPHSTTAAAPAPSSSSSSSAASKPVASQPSRPYSTTAAAPAAPAAATTAPSSGPGLLAQAGATMAGAAAGSVIGHGISNMMFGGNNNNHAEQQQQQGQGQYSQQQAYDRQSHPCFQNDVQFRQCLEQNQGGDLNGKIYIYLYIIININYYYY